jgi:hypothetical protein
MLQIGLEYAVGTGIGAAGMEVHIEIPTGYSTRRARTGFNKRGFLLDVLYHVPVYQFFIQIST